MKKPIFKENQKLSRLEVAMAGMDLVATYDNNKIKVYEKNRIRYVLKMLPNDKQEVLKVYNQGWDAHKGFPGIK